MTKVLHTFALAVAIVAMPAMAAAFSKVTDRDTFMQLLDGKELTRFGITLDVLPNGEISGRAFGRNVYGAWNWQNGYFCRSLYWGQRDLGPNCQEVRVDGSTIRFTSDQGTGDYADLTIE